MGTNLDHEYATRQIFQDYINKRDTLRRVLKNPTLTLDPGQTRKVVTLARKQFRERELASFKFWLAQFVAETNQYLATIQIKAWPMMRGLK